jgi:sulfite reductase (NADPH) flavoprotein alpha-component
LLRESGGFSSANISFPERADQAIEFRYLAPVPAHPRAFNRLVLHPQTGEVLRHERYEDKSAGARLQASIFPLHSGSYFGTIGQLVMLLSALCMPLFAVTGWMMYIARRDRARD